MKTPMLKIDAHHHLWKFSPAEYGWISAQMPALRHDFLPVDLNAVLTASGISGSVAVQARQTLEETRWLLELAHQNDFIKGVVGWVPLTDPHVKTTLDKLRANSKLKGIRHVLQDEADEHYMLRPDFNHGIAELVNMRLVYDILIFERHLPQTIQFVDRHPNQMFVVDHLAKPRVRYNAVSPWRENLAELARRPNVYCKLSGLATEADHKNWTEKQLDIYMDVVLSTFGPQRVMFGSDWPVCLLAIDYARWVKIVGAQLAKLTSSEQERVWSGTAMEVYRLG
jgi:L-fuconolactonase